MASKVSKVKPKAAPRPATKAAARPSPRFATKPASKAATRPATKHAAQAPTTRNAPRPSAGAKVPFPKKSQPPSEAEFLARLALPVGKKFEALRSFLKKHQDVAEDLYYYGPKTGWAYRYLRGSQSLATVMIHAERLVGIVALDAPALGAVDFSSLSDVGDRARRLAHGSPSLSWLDLPLDGPGAADFKTLVKAKLKTLPPPGPPPQGTRPPPPPARSSPGRGGA
jgi:hypothetical protein